VVGTDLRVLKGVILRNQQWYITIALTIDTVWTNSHTCVALAVYHTPPSASVVDLAYFIKSLSRSLPSMATVPRKGRMSVPRQRGRVRKRSAKRWVGVTGRADAGK
jgi:hypothetical protein